MFISEGLVEQHIHGCFGIDFMTCTKDELIDAAKGLFHCGAAAFFPAVMTAELNLIKERIAVIKSAAAIECPNAAQIAGVHLEGPFINPDKAGIHNKNFIQPLDIDIYKQIEDDFIKIITIAPEMDKTGRFIEYLKTKNVKISAGHTLCCDFSNVNQITHLYNAMGGLHHRNPSSAVKALLNDSLYTEIIADSKHISDDILKITFAQKPLNKILLISDALPLAHSSKTECVFSGEKIYNRAGVLVSNDGTIAGSSMLLCDIVKNIADKKLLTLKDALKAASSNLLKYHNIKNRIKVFWDKNNTAVRTESLPAV